MRLDSQRLIFTFCLLSLALFTAAHAGERPSWQPGGGAAPPAEVNKKDGIISIKRILEDPASLKGKTVKVEGVFHGWNGTCSSSYMITRSDWILEDETGCIYVTGRIPESVSPSKPQEERILVTGRIQINSKGKSIIKANQLVQQPKR